MPNQRLLEIEATIAGAHRILWKARNLCCEADMLGLENDLDQMLRELERIQKDLLTGHGRIKRT